ncbi:MAG: CpXC domain-containing protein [Enterocloster sp.]
METVACPDCGAVSYIQYDIVSSISAGRFMVCVGTDYSEVLGQSDCPGRRQSRRYVDDYKQLAEKIRIFEAGLNDKIMEITKEAMRHMAKKNLELYYAGSRRKLMYFTVPGT